MNSKIVLLLSFLALGTVMADIYYVGHNARRSMFRLEPRRVPVVQVQHFDVFDKVDSNTDTEVDTDDTEDDVSASATHSSTTSMSATTSVSATASLSATTSVSATSSVSRSPSPTVSPSPTISPMTCSGCSEHASCNTATGACKCNDRYEGSGTTCTLQTSVSGTLRFDGDASSYGSSFMTGLGSKLAENCGVPSSNVDLSIANAKAVIVTFTIYIPESLASSGVNLASVQAAMSNTTSLLAAINSVLTSLGLPTVSSVEPFIAASSTPSASPSPSSHTEDKASDSSDLSDGAIAGIVIGSVVGAILLVGLGVFLQMRHHNKTKREHAIVATAKAEDPSRPLKGKDDPINQRL